MRFMATCEVVLDHLHIAVQRVYHPHGVPDEFSVINSIPRLRPRRRQRRGLHLKLHVIHVVY